MHNLEEKRYTAILALGALEPVVKRQYTRGASQFVEHRFFSSMNALSSMYIDCNLF